MSEGVMGMLRDPKTGKPVHWSEALVYDVRCDACVKCARHPLSPHSCIFSGPFGAFRSAA